MTSGTDDAPLSPLGKIRVESSNGFANQAVRILRASMPREGIDAADYAKKVLLDPNYDMRGCLLAYRSSEGAEGERGRFGEGYQGYCLAVREQETPLAERMGFVTLLGVTPKARRQGFGSALLREAEEFLRSEGCGTALVSPYPRGYFVPGVDVEAYPEALRFLTNRGYQEIYRPPAMERSLWDYERPQWVEDIHVAHKKGLSISPPTIWAYHAHSTLRFVSETFSQDWVRILREALAEIVDGDRRDRIILAIKTRGKGTGIVGFSHYNRERFGPIGVHPDHRGQGIGHLLTHATLAAQQRAGYRSSWFLWTDEYDSGKNLQARWLPRSTKVRRAAEGTVSDPCPRKGAIVA